MLREFLHWWSSQLKDLLPAGLKSRMRQELCLLYLDVDGDQVAIQAGYRNQSHRFGQLSIDADPEDHPELQSFLAGLPRRPDRILVRLAPGRYLQRDVELPLAAEHNLNEAIGFQLDQLTPFNPDRVVYFCGLRERRPAQKKLLAWLAVTPAEQVDRALQLLGGAPPTPLRLPRKAPSKDSALEIVFRPFGQSDSRGFASTLLLASVLLLVLGASFGLHLHNRLQLRDQLAAELQAVRVEAAEASQLRDSLQQQQRQARQLGTSQHDQPPFLSLWNELTERLEDDTWLQRIDLQDGQLTIQGVSDNAPQLIELLQASPLLQQVSFGASVTRDRVTNKDRFNITARFVPGGGA